MSVIGDIMCHNTQYNDAYNNKTGQYDFSYVFEEIKDFDLEIFEKFDGDKPFTKQNLSTETLEILARIFKDIKN